MVKGSGGEGGSRAGPSGVSPIFPQLPRLGLFPSLLASPGITPSLNLLRHIPFPRAICAENDSLIAHFASSSLVLQGWGGFFGFFIILLLKDHKTPCFSNNCAMGMFCCRGSAAPSLSGLRSLSTGGFGIPPVPQRVCCHLSGDFWDLPVLRKSPRAQAGQGWRFGIGFEPFDPKYGIIPR